MNCSDFETCLLDLAGGRKQEGFLRDEALSHANVCSRCAMRLADERALASGLSALAKAARHERPTACLEERLLARLGDLKKAGMAVPASLTNIRPVGRVWWKSPRYVGLAASVFLVLGLGLLQFTRQTAVDTRQFSRAPHPSTPVKETETAPSIGVPQPPSEPVRKLARSSKNRAPQFARPIPEARVQYAARHSRRSENRLHEAESATSDRVETEFLPFMVGGPQFSSEQRHFVRVKLPRSALQVFGLPMNMERAREPVQADVLLGEDGRALAVRFIKD